MIAALDATDYICMRDYKITGPKIENMHLKFKNKRIRIDIADCITELEKYKTELSEMNGKMDQLVE